MQPFEHAWRLLKEQLNEGAPPGSTLRDQVSPELLDEDGKLSQAGSDKKYGVPPLNIFQQASLDSERAGEQPVYTQRSENGPGMSSQSQQGLDAQAALAARQTAADTFQPDTTRTMPPYSQE